MYKKTFMKHLCLALVFLMLMAYLPMRQTVSYGQEPGETTGAYLSGLVVAEDEELENEIELTVADSVYSAGVAADISVIYIRPEVTGENYTITVNGEEVDSGDIVEIPLEHGENEIEIVISETGKTPREYTVLITREEAEPSVETWEPTPEQNAILNQYNVYFGATHAHTDASAAHGNKWSQGEENVNNSASLHFEKARQIGLDFYCITDHSQYTNTFTDEKWAEQLAVAEEYTEEGEFVAIRGYEFSENDKLYAEGSSGHINVFNTAERLNADLVDVNYSFLYYELYHEHQTNPNALAGFNHPGEYDFANYGFLTKGSRDVITTIEVINGVNPKVTVDGQQKIIGGDYYNSFIKANDMGWRVSPRAGFDGHVLQAIEKLSYRCAVLASELTKDAIFGDGFRNRRTYASYDENLEVKYTVNDQWMGSVLQDPGNEFRFNILVNDPDTDNPDEVITKIEIRKNGGELVAAKEFNSHSVHWTPLIRDSEATYFFLRIWTAEKMQYKRDRHTAVVAPVWIQRGEDPLPDGPPEKIPDPLGKVSPTPFPESLPYTPRPDAEYALPIVAHEVGNEQSNNPARNSYDGNEISRWSNDGRNLSQAWITYELDKSYDINYIAIRFLNNTVNWYPIRIEVGETKDNMSVFFEGTTTMLDGYEIFQPTGDVTGPIRGKHVKITLTGRNGRGTQYISIHEIVIMENYVPPKPVTPLELSGLVAATDPGFENTYQAAIEDDKVTVQLSGSHSKIYFKPMVETTEEYTILVNQNEIGADGVSGPFDLTPGENRFTLEIAQEGFRNREYTVIVQNESSVNVRIDSNEILTVRERNDVGLCLSWITDSDQYERTYNMKQVLEMNNFGTIRWPMGTLAMNYIWNTKDENGNYHYPIKPRHLNQTQLNGSLSWVKGDEPGQIKNEMNFDEFLDLVAETGATAVIDVNAIGDLVSGNDITLEELLDAAEEQVRYARQRGFTGLYWEIGNEIESVFNTREKIDQYIARYQQFYERMKAVDPTAKIGPGLYLAAQKDNSQMPVMEALRDKMDFIVTHQYGAHGFSEDERNYDGYVNNNDPNKHAIRKIQLISGYIDELADKYGEQYRNKYEILVTEYSSYFASKWKDYPDTAVIYKGLASFEILAEMMIHPRVGPTHFWVTRTPWVSSLEQAMTTKSDHNALNWDGTLTVLGKAIAILSTNMHDTWVKAETVDDFRVKSYASIDRETKDMTIFLLNRQNTSVNASVTISNYDADEYDISAYVFEGKNGMYYDNEYKYDETEAPEIEGNELSVRLNPASVTVIKLKPLGSDRTFVISNTSIDKDAGISVNATVSPVEGSEGGKAAVAFKLLKGDAVIGVFSSEQDITEPVEFNVQFHGYSGDEYKVKIYVWDKLDNSSDSIGINLADPVEVE